MTLFFLWGNDTWFSSIPYWKIEIYRRDSFSSSDENWKYDFRKSIVRRMIQERRLRVTHTVHTRKNNRLLKTKKGLTNSLSLRQLSILSLTQSIAFQVWAKHATHSSSSLYHPSNMKLLGLHIFCFLFIEKDEFLRQILLNTNMFEIWASFYRISVAPTSQVKFFFRFS